VIDSPALLRTIAVGTALALTLAGSPVLADAEEPAEAEATSTPEAVEPESAPEPEPTPEAEVEPELPPALRTAEVPKSRLDKAADYTAIGLDAVLIRPLSFGAVAVGAPFFLVAAPFAALGGHMGATYDVFLQVPIDYAWWRPLGDL
jgi:hypothetical protein